MLSPRSLVILSFMAFAIPRALSRVADHLHDAPYGKYQHHVSIQFADQHACSGSIIDKRHILTSSSCILGTPAEDITVVAGLNSLNEKGDSYKIEKTIMLEDIFDDIALLRTREKINFHNGVQKIEIANYKDFDDDYRIKVVSWEHRLQDEFRSNDLLQEFSLRLYDKDECKRTNKWVHDKFMCIYDPDGQELCHLDQGGAIIADGRQIGIFLDKGSCYNAKEPQSHTPVYEYIDWIKENLKLKRDNGDHGRHSVAHVGAHPYHVSIRSNKKHICSGSIINERHVLTSNNCIMGNQPKDLTVMAGITSLSGKGRRYQVQKIVPTYNDDYDMAILRITRKFVFNDRVNSIPIITHSYEIDATDGITLTGWEREVTDVNNNDKLQVISSQIYDREKCEQVIPFLSEAYMCGMEISSSQVCNIDYGGPIVANGIQIGLNPFGVRCEGNNEPHLFLSLSRHSSWIDRNSRV